MKTILRITSVICFVIGISGIIIGTRIWYDNQNRQEGSGIVKDIYLAEDSLSFDFVFKEDTLHHYEVLQKEGEKIFNEINEDDTLEVKFIDTESENYSQVFFLKKKQRVILSREPIVDKRNDVYVFLIGITMICVGYWCWKGGRFAR
ncbi:MAG: hypothetical protein ACKOXB_07575 [Flavobacteriales bacterium]